MRNVQSVIVTPQNFAQFKSTFSGDLSAYAIKAEFLDYSIERVLDEKFVVYPIRVYNAHYENTIYKRFGDFHAFYKELKEKYKKLKLPRLPKKSLINNFEPEFLERRRAKLQRFLNELLGILRYNFIMEICAFIELSQASINCILDLGQSGVSLPDTFMTPYLSVVYSEKDVKGRFDALAALLVAERAPKEFLGLLFHGRDNFKSLFQFGFNRDFRAEKHRLCFLAADFFLRLLEGKGQNQEEAQRLLRNMKEKDFRTIGFAAHLGAHEISRCRMACHRLLKLYQALNQQASTFFLFASYDEYERFKQWSASLETRFGRVSASFPHYLDFFENEAVNAELVVRTLDVYCEKNSLDLLIADEQNLLVRAGIMINEGQKEALLKALPAARWLAEMFDDCVAFSSHVFSLLQVKKSSPKVVIVRPMVGDTLLREDRVTLYFLPTESEPAREHLLTECPALRSLNGAPPSHTMREKHSHGFFFDIEAIPNTRKHVLAVLVKFFPRSTHEVDRRKKLQRMAAFMQGIQNFIGRLFN